MPDLAFIAIVPDDRQAGLQRRFGIDTVQEIELNRLGPEPAQALLDLRTENLPPPLAGRVAALGGDNAPLRERRQRSPDRPLALAPGVEVGGVDEIDPGPNRVAQKRLVAGRVR